MRLIISQELEVSLEPAAQNFLKLYREKKISYSQQWKEHWSGGCCERSMHDGSQLWMMVMALWSTAAVPEGTAALQWNSLVPSSNTKTCRLSLHKFPACNFLTKAREDRAHSSILSPAPNPTEAQENSWLEEQVVDDSCNTSFSERCRGNQE